MPGRSQKYKLQLCDHHGGRVTSRFPAPFTPLVLHFHHAPALHNAMCWVRSVRDTFFPEVKTLPINRSQNTWGAIHLAVGETYYFELLHKERCGGDGCAVVWWMEGENMPEDGTLAIPGEFLRNYVDPGNYIIVTEQPEDVKVEAGDPFEMRANAHSYSPVGFPVHYQWRKNGENINGANAGVFSIPKTTVGSAGEDDVMMTAPGAGPVLSDTARLMISQTALGISLDGDDVQIRWPESSTGYVLEKSMQLGGAADWQIDIANLTTNGGFRIIKQTTWGGDTVTYWRLRK
jgi:predicted RecA/RadA family phage recombinase